MAKKIPVLLTIDLEEFDIPLEFGQKIELDKQLSVSLEGLNRLLPLFKKHNITATFFTTAQWAMHHPDTMRQLVSEKHEIASHAFYHSSFEIEIVGSSPSVLMPTILKVSSGHCSSSSH